VNIRYKIRPGDEWDEGWLLMHEDYTNQKYERLSSQHFGLELGDTVHFEVNDRLKIRTISGKLRHNFVPPPDFGGPAVFLPTPKGWNCLIFPRASTIS
jgi:putative ABC transport system permease protein